MLFHCSLAASVLSAAVGPLPSAATSLRPIRTTTSPVCYICLSTLYFAGCRIAPSFGTGATHLYYLPLCASRINLPHRVSRSGLPHAPSALSDALRPSSLAVAAISVKLRRIGMARTKGSFKKNKKKWRSGVVHLIPFRPVHKNAPVTGQLCVCVPEFKAESQSEAQFRPTVFINTTFYDCSRHHRILFENKCTVRTTCFVPFRVPRGWPVGRCVAWRACNDLHCRLSWQSVLSHIIRDRSRSRPFAIASVHALPLPAYRCLRADMSYLLSKI